LNKNEYRRALIMLRSLKGGVSGYVRLERRTLMGTLQYTLNGASSAGELYALLLCRQNGTWHAVRCDRFGTPRGGQCGMVWKFDPRNIEGRTLEQYSLTAVTEIRNGVCELLLCGNLSGSVQPDWQQIREAACRLFTPVRISTAPIPPIPYPEESPDSSAPSVPDEEQTDSPCCDEDDIQTLPDFSEEFPAYSDDADASELETILSQEPVEPIRTSDGSTSSEPSEAIPNESDHAFRPDQSSCETDSSTPPEIISENSASLLQTEIPPDELDSPAQSEIVPDELDSPAQSEIVPDELDSPAQSEIIPDELDSPAQSEIIPDELDSPAQSEIIPDELDSPADSDTFVQSSVREIAFSMPAEIIPDELDTPAQSAMIPDELDFPAQSEIVPDELDMPALDADEAFFSVPARFPADPESEEIFDESDESSPSERTAGELLSLSDPDARWHDSVEPLRRLFFSRESVKPFEMEGYIFIRAPLSEENGFPNCLCGIRCENGIPVNVCYAIPAPYTTEPPPGMEDYSWRGTCTRGYWTICDSIPS